MFYVPIYVVNFLVGAVIEVVPFRVLLIDCIGLEFIKLTGGAQYLTRT